MLSILQLLIHFGEVAPNLAYCDTHLVIYHAYLQSFFLIILFIKNYYVNKKVFHLHDMNTINLNQLLDFDKL
ncbi:Uncharacterised protein [Porphyromonas macacae]|uniref:Uncharacterized protein n=1 Tax=Porphyromonas macacae TaxID=28115 RepID=A0A379DJ25_9PORP|nr:Uncharacterised protein [Porphyromonas macacae]